MNNKIWDADIYLRLSKEDGDKISEGKIDSDSITNQKKLALDFIKDRVDIRLHKIRIDDGYTGSNFDRPAFQEMLDDIRTGVVNCVIVKDLSRFGREYIGAGDYIQKIFPSLGVRFISINDGVDSINKTSANDAILIPFKNLINDMYCGDISNKIRSMFDVKRKNGDFIGSFAMYGYRKDPENKNRLLIDEAAAAIVKEVFRLKLAGMSADNIAKKLNTLGVPSPMEYKKANGIPYYTSFSSSGKGQWVPQSVTNILKNETYIGTLIQGKAGTPNHKVKTRIKKPREEWIIVENNHPPIISKMDFETVQKLLKLDTRTSPHGTVVYLLSGLVYCGECGANMVRKVVPSGKNKRAYLVCNTRKKCGECDNHSISVDKVEHYVMKALEAQINNLVEVGELIKSYSEDSLLSIKLANITALIDEKQNKISELRGFKKTLYESLMKGIISKEDYHQYSIDYDNKIKELEQHCEKLKDEAEGYMERKGSKEEWIKNFEIYKRITKFDRDVLVNLIDQIKIMKDGQIQIDFSFQDEYAHLLNMVTTSQREGRAV